MADSESDLVSTVIAHLARKGLSPLVCPVCSATEWHVYRIIFPTLHDDGGPKPDAVIPGSRNFIPRAEGLPMVPLKCRTCAFVYQFAYLPMVEPEEGGSGG